MNKIKIGIWALIIVFSYTNCSREGCTDEEAVNFSENAKEDDGSCLYQTPIYTEWLNPNIAYGSVSDIDGNVYTTVVIGGVEWMAENLRSSRFANGDTIPNVADSIAWNALRAEGWAHFNNDESREVPYGKLYNWYAAGDNRNICPEGWHLPSDEEWKQLSDTLGTDSISGGKLKSLFGWNQPNVGDINSSGFSGLPGHYRRIDGGFTTPGAYGYYWTSTRVGSSRARFYILFYNSQSLFPGVDQIRQGFSCRCVKD